jgi:hypothetical protein
MIDMSKALTAKEILERRGLNIKLKFNIEDFAMVIGEWFLENNYTEVLIVPFNFAVTGDEFPQGFADVTALLSLRDFELSDYMPSGWKGFSFFVDKRFITDVIYALHDKYKYSTVKHTKGTFIISLIP